MNKLLIIMTGLLVILPVLSQELKVKKGKILPIELVNYPLDKFIKEYAEKSGLRISYSKRIIKKRDKLNLSLRKEISLDNLHQYVIKILNNRGLTFTEDFGGWSIIKMRDIRYIPVKIFSSKSFPDTNEYITIVHKMKHPLAKGASRSLRPYSSRYARNVSFNDNKTIILNEIGASSAQLLKIIKSLDTQESYNKYLKDKEEKSLKESKKTPKGKSIEKLEKKIADMEREKKRLKKKVKNKMNNKGAKNVK